MNKKYQIIAVVFAVILFFIAGLVVRIYKNNKLPKYKPTETKEYSSYAEWKDECIKINAEDFPFLFDVYYDASKVITSEVISCTGSNGDAEFLNAVLKGDEIYDFNYEDFPDLKKHIIIDTTSEVDTNKQNDHPDWELYKNQDLGFELKFPNNFDQSPSYFESNKLGGFSITKIYNSPMCDVSVSVYDGKVYNLLRMPPIFEKLNAEKLNIDGQVVTKYSYYYKAVYFQAPTSTSDSNYQQGQQDPDTIVTSLVIVKNGKVYEIKGHADKGGLEENQMEEIIDTFKPI